MKALQSVFEKEKRNVVIKLVCPNVKKVVSFQCFAAKICPTCFLLMPC